MQLPPSLRFQSVWVQPNTLFPSATDVSQRLEANTPGLVVDVNGLQPDRWELTAANGFEETATDTAITQAAEAIGLTVLPDKK